jgi:hypothetical protein
VFLLETWPGLASFVEKESLIRTFKLLSESGCSVAVHGVVFRFCGTQHSGTALHVDGCRTDSKRPCMWATKVGTGLVTVVMAQALCGCRWAELGCTIVVCVVRLPCQEALGGCTAVDLTWRLHWTIAPGWLWQEWPAWHSYHRLLCLQSASLGRERLDNKLGKAVKEVDAMCY